MEVYRAISPAGELDYQRQKSNTTSSAIRHFRQDGLFSVSPPWRLIGDGALIHRRKEVKEWLRTETLEGRAPLARFPVYRPQFQADEPVWAWHHGRPLKTGGGHTLEPSRKRFPANPAIIQQGFEHPEVAFS